MSKILILSSGLLTIYLVLIVKKLAMNHESEIKVAIDFNEIKDRASEIKNVAETSDDNIKETIVDER